MKSGVIHNNHAFGLKAWDQCELAPTIYDWTNREIGKRQIHCNHCGLLVRAAHSDNKEHYGIDRLHAKRIEQGLDISLYMVRRIKKEYGIKCRHHKRYKFNRQLFIKLSDRKFLG